MLFKIKMGLLLGVIMLCFSGCFSHQGMFAPPNLNFNYAFQNKKLSLLNPTQSVIIAPIDFNFVDSKINPYYSKKYALALKEGLQNILKNQGYEVLKKPHRNLKNLFLKLKPLKQIPLFKLKTQAYLKLDFKEVGFEEQEKNNLKRFVLLAKGAVRLEFYNRNEERLGFLIVPIETKELMLEHDDSIETYPYVRAKENMDNNANFKQALSQIYHFTMQRLEAELSQQVLKSILKPTDSREKSTAFGYN
ncbi:HpaA family protein [Helicobacter cetorum]|uniref:HpaA family protein n=1 Tax=Helicobacter cetorum TaxID=138563 RepID=UPI000CF015E8|nr:HpaA family protein [Helicobacter cetorum]